MYKRDTIESINKSRQRYEQIAREMTNEKIGNYALYEMNFGRDISIKEKETEYFKNINKTIKQVVPIVESSKQKRKSLW